MTGRLTGRLTGGLSGAEQRLLATLDEESLRADLVELLRVPSVVGTDDEYDIVELVESKVAGFDVHLDRWQFDLDELAADPDYPGHEVHRDRAQGLVATTTSPGETPALVLQGHLDVVPAGELGHWRGTDPFAAETRGEKILGRGACDMKAGVAANIAVLRTLRDAGVEVPGGLGLHFVVGEEDGGLGAFATMRRGHRAGASIITEPTNGRLVIGNAGALTFRIEVEGRSAHGSMRREGVSAFEAFLPIHAALLRLEAERNADPDQLFGTRSLPYALCFGTVHTGDWSSTVPDRLVTEGRYGVRLGESPALARAAFEAVIGEVVAADPWLREHPPTVTWPGGQFASGLTDPDADVVQVLTGAVADSGGPVPEIGAEVYGSDLRLYREFGGIETVHFGPGDVKFAHAPLEHVDVADLVQSTKALLLAASRMAG